MVDKFWVKHLEKAFPFHYRNMNYLAWKEDGWGEKCKLVSHHLPQEININLITKVTDRALTKVKIQNEPNQTPQLIPLSRNRIWT